LKLKRRLENLGVQGIKKLNSNMKEDARVWTGFIWHRKWTSGGKENSGSIKR